MAATARSDGVPGPAGGLRGGTVQAEHVVAEPAATGHPGRVPQRRGTIGVTGERGRPFEPLPGLAQQVAGEGRFGQGRGETAGARTPLRPVGGPGKGGPQVLRHRVEPHAPVRAPGSGELQRAGRTPIRVTAPDDASSPRRQTSRTSSTPTCCRGTSCS
ncbi:hypothetical protein GCM10010405_13720 [Streptomyces macrosporus]|uniref:Uncharacterized protein n=1 Tax=Streptomyces macrosporus TaxID=44032 RepID=A0ABN3JJ89_9ACTN